MIIIVRDHITLLELQEMAKNGFGNLVKGVVDIEKHICAFGGDLHADEEAELIKQGSNQKNLWGINVYQDLPYPDRIEFDSMINVRPQAGNLTRGVDDPKIQERIITLMKSIIIE
jgi:hypothetical protein